MVNVQFPILTRAIFGAMTGKCLGQPLSHRESVARASGPGEGYHKVFFKVFRVPQAVRRCGPARVPVVDGIVRSWRIELPRGFGCASGAARLVWTGAPAASP